MLKSVQKAVLPVALVLAASGCGANLANGQPRGLFAPGRPTLGGWMMWSDEVVYQGWRIQKHGVIGHYQLIDPSNRQLVRGTFDACLAKLDEVKVQQKLAPLPKSVVIVVHGLGAYRNIMSGIANYLTDEGGYYVINFGYPSTIGEIGGHAQSLDSVIRHLDGVEHISFVAHSMGNIVIRKYLYDLQQLAPEMRPKVTFDRMVMISPPNHGAEIADALHSREVTRSLSELVAGKPAEQLAPGRGWPELEKQLVTPTFEFGIIAGGRGDDSGYLSAIPGDDDALLSIETMKLAGASDYIQTRGVHQLMPRYNEVRAATLSFLKNGYFVSADARQPIAAVAAQPPAAAAPASP